MIPDETEANILRHHYVDKWPPGTIATTLGVHHETVTRVLSQNGVQPHTLATRPSMVTPYLPFILETLKRHPQLTAKRLHDMVKERGYSGKPDHFRGIVARYRPRPTPEAYFRLRTLPGEQAQVDWAHFGKLRVGRALRTLWAFVMVLSYSRQIFLRFYFGQSMSCFLAGHQQAFESFGGCARVLLYDNLKSAVLERQGALIRFNPTLIAFANHYHYEPRPVAVARGNEKGRVERAIRYIRDAFFAARTFSDIDDLNAQANAWCLTQASERKCPEDATLTVHQAFERERSRLLPLPSDAFPTDDRVEVSVGKTPYVRFDLNDYSIPHTHVRRTLVVLANQTSVRILDKSTLLATHPRSYDRDQQAEHPEHILALAERKQQARAQRGLDHLARAVPVTRDLLACLAERGLPLGSATAALLRLLESYGPAELEAAVAQAIASDTPHIHAVRQIIEKRRQESGQPPPIPVALPDNKRVRELSVRPHDLRSYDQLTQEKDDESNNSKH